ncbi:hypothetical protein [Methanocella conradii]|uniref:hypothetical protein n=1 Tax=Methanocella conradii TaxID=1175444 RepID=UPI00157BFA8A|nr:hypothetical protein [Methanocella conradii]
MMPGEDAVSELLGYAVLAAVVSIAAAGLLAGSMGVISSSERGMEYSGSISAFKGLEGIVSFVVEDDNTFYVAYEMSVPRGYELLAMDVHDDYRSISIYSGSSRLAFLPMGSIALRSPFRTISFEGGAVISNDTGLVKAESAPAIHAIPLASGKKALYMSITAVSCDSFVRREGPITLYVKCSSSEAISWGVPEGLTIWVRSGDLKAWKDSFDGCGLTTAYEGGALKATSNEVSEIHVVYSEVKVER